MGHEICGITCNGHRMMYSGWISHTIDSGIGSQNITRKVPCRYMKHDWLDKTESHFCIDAAKCDLKFGNGKNELKNGVCFNYMSGPRSYLYIREDLLAKKPLLAVLPHDKVVCPKGKILNPKTKRCVDITGKIGKTLLKP
jgi:hypothetical protein